MSKVIAGLGLVLSGVVGAGIGQANAAQESAGMPRYSVVETQGTNLLVTDNQTNKLFFYTVDRGKEAGEELRLRGTVDLNKVGEKVIKPESTTKPNM